MGIVRTPRREGTTHRAERRALAPSLPHFGWRVARSAPPFSSLARASRRLCGMRGSAHRPGRWATPTYARPPRFGAPPWPLRPGTVCAPVRGGCGFPARRLVEERGDGEWGARFSGYFSGMRLREAGTELFFKAGDEEERENENNADGAQVIFFFIREETGHAFNPKKNIWCWKLTVPNFCRQVPDHQISSSHGRRKLKLEKRLLRSLTITSMQYLYCVQCVLLSHSCTGTDGTLSPATANSPFGPFGE